MAGISFKDICLNAQEQADARQKIVHVYSSPNGCFYTCNLDNYKDLRPVAIIRPKSIIGRVHVNRMLARMGYPRV